MGACLSCGSSGSTSSKFDTIRLVDLNGHVEDFNHPLTVAEVMGKPPKHYVCSAAQLASVGFNPLPPQTHLHPGIVYILLPLSVLDFEFSPADMAAIAKELTAKAKSVSSSNFSPKISPSPRPKGMTTSFGVEAEYSCRPWKPGLDAIREASLEMR